MLPKEPNVLLWQVATHVLCYRSWLPLAVLRPQVAHFAPVDQCQVNQRGKGK